MAIKALREIQDPHMKRKNTKGGLGDNSNSINLMALEFVKDDFDPNSKAGAFDAQEVEGMMSHIQQSLSRIEKQESRQFDEGSFFGITEEDEFADLEDEGLFTSKPIR
jgi:hypothetical protein